VLLARERASALRKVLGAQQLASNRSGDQFIPPGGWSREPAADQTARR
jgi:hypothetical protein